MSVIFKQAGTWVNNNENETCVSSRIATMEELN